MTLRRLLYTLAIVFPIMLLAFQLLDVRVDAGEENAIPAPEEKASTFQVRDEGAPDDAAMLLQWLAFPQIVFPRDSAPQIELFAAEDLPKQYLIIDGERALRLRVDWRGVWMSDSLGWTELNLEVQVRPPWRTEEGDDGFEAWASEWDGGGDWGPHLIDGRLDATLWFEQPGRYDLRLTLAVVAERDPEREGQEPATVRRQATYHSTLIAFNGGTSAPDQPGNYQPAFGQIEWDGGLLDWRAWRFGPCNLTSDDPALTALLDSACLAFEQDDLAGVGALLSEALRVAGDVDELALLATLRGQLGLLAADAGSANLALRHFNEALRLWESLGDPVQTAAALHNLGIVLWAQDRWIEAEQHLLLAAQLDEQNDVWLGALLSWAQLSVLYDDPEGVFYKLFELAEAGMPQAEPLAAWLAETYDLDEALKDVDPQMLQAWQELVEAGLTREE